MAKRKAADRQPPARKTATRKTATRKPAKRKTAKTRTTKRAATKRSAKKRTTATRKPAKRETAKRETAQPTTARGAPLDAIVSDEEQLKAELDLAITAFNTRRTALLREAFDEGGDAAVASLQQQHDALRSAFFELLKRQLDRNNAQFVALTSAATLEAAALTSAIESLANVASIIRLAASVVGLIGKVTTVLGV